jgi:hypothetical protein
LSLNKAVADARLKILPKLPRTCSSIDIAT